MQQEITSVNAKRAGEPLVSDLQDYQQQIEANGINLARVKVTSPVTTLIKLSLGQAFGLIATHNRRHLWQARQVKGNEMFPAREAAI